MCYKRAMLEIAFVGVLAALAGCFVGLRRSQERRTATLFVAAPFFVLSAYEMVVARVMPDANIRLDWFVLFPCVLGLVALLAYRWRGLE